MLIIIIAALDSYTTKKICFVLSFYRILCTYKSKSKSIIIAGISRRLKAEWFGCFAFVLLTALKNGWIQWKCIFAIVIVYRTCYLVATIDHLIEFRYDRPELVMMNFLLMICDLCLCMYLNLPVARNHLPIVLIAAAFFHCFRVFHFVFGSVFRCYFHFNCKFWWRERAANEKKEKKKNKTVFVSSIEIRHIREYSHKMDFKIAMHGWVCKRFLLFCRLLRPPLFSRHVIE